MRGSECTFAFIQFDKLLLEMEDTFVENLDDCFKGRELTMLTIACARRFGWMVLTLVCVNAITTKHVRVSGRRPGRSLQARFCDSDDGLIGNTSKMGLHNPHTIIRTRWGDCGSGTNHVH